jgi:hypothetical protein
MPATQELLEWYRGQAKIAIGKINDELEQARWQKQRAIAEEQISAALASDDVAIARTLGVLQATVTSAEAQAKIDLLQAQKAALQRFIEQTIA